MAMVTARARVPAMACVGEPAADRGARRRRDLWRSSASRVAVTSKPLRPVKKFGLPRSKEQRAPLLLPNLGRRSGPRTDTRTGHTESRTRIQTNRKVTPLAKTYRVARALFSRGRLISEASLPVFHGGKVGKEVSAWGKVHGHGQLGTAHEDHCDNLHTCL